MKQLKFFLSLLLIITCRVSPLQGQCGVRDSLINESLRLFFSEHVNLMSGTSRFMIAAHTFPYDYDLSMWDNEDKVDIVNLNDRKTIRHYKRTREAVPTVCLKWRIGQDGFMIFTVALYYVKVRGKTIDYALSDACIYYYKHSDSERKWMLASKSCNGV